jgi:hypothetical protein
MFRPIDRYLTNKGLNEQQWLREEYPRLLVRIGKNDPQRMFLWFDGKDDDEVDLKDLSILADFLGMIVCCLSLLILRLASSQLPRGLFLVKL